MEGFGAVCVEESCPSDQGVNSILAAHQSGFQVNAAVHF